MSVVIFCKILTQALYGAAQLQGNVNYAATDGFTQFFPLILMLVWKILYVHTFWRIKISLSQACAC